MFTATFPQELVDKIVESIEDDRTSLIALSKVNMRWARRSRPYLLSDLVFKDEQDIINFSMLLRASNRTFPPFIRCKALALYNATTICDEAPTSVRNVLASITVEKSLKIHVTDGRIPRSIVEASTAWSSIPQLTLLGGGYNIQAFFDYLSSFTQLKSLQLEDFSLMVAEGATEPTVQLRLPSTLVRLATLRSSGVWTILHRLLPGGGFPRIRHLHIQALFWYEEPGVWDMVQYLGGVEGLDTLKLDALYHPNWRDLKRVMGTIFQNWDMSLMRIPGLQLLDLDFSKIPASFALATLSTHVIFVPLHPCTKTLNIAVEITVPESPVLWNESDPEGQLRQLILETTPPAGTPESETTGQPTFTLHQFPGMLREDERANARVCGYPISIVEVTRAQEQKQVQAPVNGYLRGLVSKLWMWLKDYFA